MVYTKKASLWEFSILDLTHNSYWYRGVLLKGDHNHLRLKKHSAFSNAITILRSYFFKVYAHQDIVITSGTQTIKTRTDAYGRFEIVSDVKPQAELTITLSNTKLPLKILQDYPVNFQEPQRTLDIISDIDDTVLVSNTSNIFKRIKTLLLLVPEKRTVIGFTQNMFKAWHDVNPRYFYVSKSESNLFTLLTTFITYNTLPIGMLVLTPYLNFFQLLKGHKPKDFKLEAIQFLITHSRGENYVLVGDDSQKDMVIYTKLAKMYPNLILKIYIRQTGKIRSIIQQTMWNELIATGVSASYVVPDEASSILKDIEHLKQHLK